MRTVLAYRHTGEDPAYLKRLLTPIRDVLESKGIEVFCTFFLPAAIQDNHTGPRDFMMDAFKELNGVDFLFVLQASKERSEGMLMEVGYCWAKGIPVIVATQEDITNTYLPAMATTSIRWRDADELTTVLQDMNIQENIQKAAAASRVEPLSAVGHLV